MRRRMPTSVREVSTEQGATMVEYAILMAFIGAMLIGSLTIFRGALESLFTTAAAIF